MREQHAELSERLSAIVESLPKGVVVCDVGTDHGSLPLYLLQNGLCQRAVVTDLNKKPLERAKKALSEGGVSDQADFLLTDGIVETFSYAPAAYVIAGMGGETIAGILDRGVGGIKEGTVFLLQPMTKVSELRRYLYENGFWIENEKVVFENKKVFVILSAKFDGICRSVSEEVCLFGEYFPKQKGEVVFLYWIEMERKIRSKIEGMNKAGLSTEREESWLRFCLTQLEEYNENL